MVDHVVKWRSASRRQRREQGPGPESVEVLRAPRAVEWLRVSRHRATVHHRRSRLMIWPCKNVNRAW
eukprot:797452-Prymnesium_polylepis.1